MPEALVVIISGGVGLAIGFFLGFITGAYEKEKE
jgi:ABC-type dipeptide/oligopeptide/nickel transport system permease subunit